MKRRTFLGLAGTAGTAGCLAAPPRSASARRDTPASGAEEGEPRRATLGRPTDICERPIEPESGIYAITEPAFATDWRGHEIGLAYRHYRGGPRLDREQTVIGVSWDGGARAYPVSVLQHHEVVNDTAGDALLVTFCPLCSSGMVASRRLRGSATRFAVTGQLWRPERIYARASEDRGRTFGAGYAGGEADIRRNGNLVMYDAATHSFWSQLLAGAICGPLADTDLTIRPSTAATWADWRERHPDTEVLLPPPYSGTVAPGVVLGRG